jgi:hypothetical protein
VNQPGGAASALPELIHNSVTSKPMHMNIRLNKSIFSPGQISKIPIAMRVGRPYGQVQWTLG